jgi:peptidoglycan/xylan/chitin deacetylase (PgdA/CDA1 family)
MSGPSSAPHAERPLGAIPDRLVVLTFDDGCRSQFTFVAPLLKELGFGATFYITEGLRFLEDKERYMSWEEVRQLHEAGFEIGNHTRRHKNVNTQSPAELRADIDHIDQRCSEHGISRPHTFCYPGYSNGPEAVATLAERGFTFARRGTAPEFAYDPEGGRGPAYYPRGHHPLLVPTTGAAGPHWSHEDLVWAVDQASDGHITVLTFHGVPDLDHPWVHTAPEDFVGYMRYLADRGCVVISLSDLENYVAAPSS